MAGALLAALEAGRRGLHRLSRWAAWACGAGLLGAALLIFAEIVFRNFDRASYVGAAELSGYVFAVTIAWGLSFCLHERAHVRIDIGYARLPQGLRTALDLMALAALLTLAVVLASRAQMALSMSLRFRSASVTPLRVPLAWPQTAWALGLGFFALNCAWLLVQGLVLLVLGRPDLARRLYPVEGAGVGAGARPQR